LIVRLEQKGLLEPTIRNILSTNTSYAEHL
jgi:hypothetical protein